MVGMIFSNKNMFTLRPALTSDYNGYFTVTDLWYILGTCFRNKHKP